ncbi:MAG: metallophosphoesterase [Magnetospirillum sp.]
MKQENHSSAFVANPSVPEGLAVYAVGDIHGRLDLLDRLLSTIATDVSVTSPLQVSVVFLGDMVDRGPDSRGVIDRLAAGPPPTLSGAEWVCLRGNHEEAMQDFLADSSTGGRWFPWGGLETVRSYVGEEAMLGWRGDMAEAQLSFRRHVPTSHRRFLDNLKLTHQIGDYLFVHAGIKPGVALDQQHPADLLWIRHEFLDDERWHGRMVVHGHTPDLQPQVRSNRLGIDTMAYDSGVLTALALRGSTRRFLHT